MPTHLGEGADRAGAVTVVDGPRALDVLVEAKPESEPAIRRILHEHNLNSLFELLVPIEASYRFAHLEVHPLGDRFADHTDELLEKAQARLEIWRSIAVRIPSTSAVFRLAASLPDKADQRLVTADEWRFISLVDGRSDVAKLIEDTGESAFACARRSTDCSSKDWSKKPQTLRAASAFEVRSGVDRSA